MNLRIDSMPRQNTMAWAIHMMPNAIQPSSDSPAKPYCVDVGVRGEARPELERQQHQRADAR